MGETMLERAVSFFMSPARCRQNYLEAWQIGKAVYDDRESLRTQLEAERERVRVARGAIEAAIMVVEAEYKNSSCDHQRCGHGEVCESCMWLFKIRAEIFRPHVGSVDALATINKTDEEVLRGKK